MFRNSVATESSGEWASAMDTLIGSTDSQPAPGNQNDSSSPSQVDKADTSYHATSNGSHIAETTIISPLTPPYPTPLILSKPTQPASLPPADPTHETHVRINELPENNAQSPSDGVDASQLPQLSPLLPLRRLSQSQTVPQDTFTHAASPASSAAPQELPSQHPQESYHVPAAKTSPSSAGGSIPAPFLAAGISSHNGSPIAETIPTVLSPSLPPPPVLSKLAQPASLIGGPPADPIHVGIGELPRNQAQSAYSPSDGIDASQLPQLPPLLPVRRLSQSQSNIQAQPIKIPPPVSRNTSTHATIPASPVVPQELPSQYSQESHRVPTAPTPPSRADGGIRASFSGNPQMSHQNWNSNPPHIPPPPTPQQYAIPRRQSVNIPSMHYGTPSQPSRPQSSTAPHPYSSGPTRPIVPQSALPQLYSLPNAPTPQAQSIHMGTPQRNFAYSASPQPYSLSSALSPQAHSSRVGTPQQFGPQSAPQLYSIPGASISQAGSTNVGLPPGFVPQRFTPYSTSPHTHGLSGAPTPPTHLSHAGTPQQFGPQTTPQSYSIPGVSTPQAAGSTHMGLPQGFPPQSASPYYAPTPQAQSIHVGTPRPSISQTPVSGFGYGLSPNPPIIPPVKPQPRSRMNSFVANDPFQVSHGDDKADRLPDVLSFDDIPTPVSTSGPKFSLGMANSPYGSLPSNPIIPPSLEAYPYGYGSTQPGIYPSSNIPGPQILPMRPSWGSTAPAPQIPPGRPSWAPEPPNQYQSPFISPYDPSGISVGPDYGAPVIPPMMPSSPSSSSASEQPVPSQIPVPPQSYPESHVSSPQQSPRISEPKSDNSDMWIPALPIHQFPSRPEDIFSNSNESKTGTDESSFRPYIPPYPQDSKYRPPEPIFSRLTRFFRWSHHIQPLGTPQPSTVTYPPIKPNTSWREHEITKVTIQFVWVTLPMQMYLYVLLRLPSLYFSRVARIFEEADMTLPEIKKMALETASQGLTHEFEIQEAFESTSVSPAYKRLTSTWEFFIDSVMREWKTFNIISVLLLSAILTILQIEDAGQDPLTRYTALFSLMCALISLLFGCMYIIRFGSMRKTYKAAEWALEARRTKTLIWWNVWVLLAMPAIWLTWSILLYIACIMSFVWRSGVASATTTRAISDTKVLVIRIVMTAVLGIGVIYAFLIMTTFRRYGAAMDRKWKQRIDKWIEEKEAVGKHGPYPQPTLGNPQLPPTPHAYPDGSTMHQGPTYNSSPYYQPSLGDTHSHYADTVYGPTYSSDAYVPPPEPYWTPTDLPHDPWGSSQGDHAWGAYTPAYASDNYLSPTEIGVTTPTWSPDDVTRANTTMNAGYFLSPYTTPPAPLPPTVPISYAGGASQSLVPEKPHLVLKTRRKKRAHFAVPPSPSLPPIPGTPVDLSSDDKVIGSSSGLKNRVGGNDDGDDDDALDNLKNRVRFRSPIISDRGSSNLRTSLNKVSGTPREWAI